MTRGQLRALWIDQHRAAVALRRARSQAADDGMFPMREMAVIIAARVLAKAEARCAKAKAAWEAAGRPDPKGNVTRSPDTTPTKEK